MVILKNAGLETFTATYYPSICGRRCKDRLYAVRKMRSPQGKLIGVKQPYSFTILPGQAVEVHDVALHLPQVKAARKKGRLELLERSVIQAAVTPRSWDIDTEGAE